MDGIQNGSEEVPDEGVVVRACACVAGEQLRLLGGVLHTVRKSQVAATLAGD